MELQDIRIDEYFDSPVMPFGMKITHLPTGLHVMGNCKHESSKMNLQRQLTDQLGIFVAQAEGKDASLRRKSAAERDNEMLRDQLSAMQAQIDRLSGRKPAKPEPVAAPVPTKRKPKKKGKGGWSEERRAAAAERMRQMQAEKHGKVATPAGAKTEAQLLAEQMRPPTDAPRPLPKAHASRGSTVAVVSPESQARGYRP